VVLITTCPTVQQHSLVRIVGSCRTCRPIFSGRTMSGLVF